MPIYICSLAIRDKNRMHKLSVLHQLILADLRERTRRYSFLITMLGVSFFGYLVITGKYTVQFGDMRTVYDSVWAGSVMAVTSSIMVALIGFYLVKGSITHDRRTEVGQIIAATPLGRFAYMTSKLISNMIILWLMIAVLALLAFMMLLFGNEAASLDIYAFSLPFLIISLPTSIFVAAMAVLFDTARWLRGSVGNIFYLWVAEASLVLGMLAVPLLDLAAVSFFTDSVRGAAALAYPGEKISMIMGFVMYDPSMKSAEIRLFEWAGIDWSK